MRQRPIGTATRGTTNPNRLRRMDRWIAATHGPALRRSDSPVAVDLGYGAAPWTAVELLQRLRARGNRVRIRVDDELRADRLHLVAILGGREIV